MILEANNLSDSCYITGIDADGIRLNKWLFIKLQNTGMGQNSYDVQLDSAETTILNKKLKTSEFGTFIKFLCFYNYTYEKVFLKDKLVLIHVSVNKSFTRKMLIKHFEYFFYYHNDSLFDVELKNINKLKAEKFMKKNF